MPGEDAPAFSGLLLPSCFFPSGLVCMSSLIRSVCQTSSSHLFKQLKWTHLVLPRETCKGVFGEL